MLQEYTETIQRLSEGGILELFQRKYTHSLIVSFLPETSNDKFPLSIILLTFILWIAPNCVKVGVGLMVLQQFGGVNGIAFYASAIFITAGK